MGITCASNSNIQIIIKDNINKITNKLTTIFTNTEGVILNKTIPIRIRFKIKINNNNTITHKTKIFLYNLNNKQHNSHKINCLIY